MACLLPAYHTTLQRARLRQCSALDSTCVLCACLLQHTVPPLCPSLPPSLPLQGLPMREVRRQAAELLEAVKLGPAANLRTSAYSGGMRRRLRWARVPAWGCR